MKRLRRVLCMVLVFAIMASMLSVTAFASSANKSGFKDRSEPTIEELVKKYDNITVPTARFITRPSAKYPYVLGQLDQKYLQAGCDYISMMRYQAGLPDVYLDSGLTTNAQYGAILQGALEGAPNHNPSKPSDMSNEFYTQGKAAAQSSNLHSIFWGANYGQAFFDKGRISNALRSDIKGCMNDDDDGNARYVGHRRWFLYPTLKYIGIGETDSKNMIAHYSVFKIFDESGDTHDYDFIAWPASGNMMSNLVDVETPWSVTLNPGKYDTSKLKNITVTLKNESTGKTWTFNSSSNSNPSGSTPYLSVDNQNWFGVQNCIVFRPDYSQIKDFYTGNWSVSIKGLTQKSGGTTEINYVVKFFRAEDHCNHSWGTPFTDPGKCIEKKTCTKCGKTVETGKKVHEWKSTVEVQKEVTCTEDGITILTCKKCGEKETRVTKAPGHTWRIAAITEYDEDGNPITGLYECDVCGAEKTAKLCASEIFDDVPPESNWAHEGIDFAVIRGLFMGTSNTKFSPETTMTRAMLVTVLWRMEGKPFNNTSIPFTDVKDKDYFQEAVRWAYSKGVVAGTSETTFSPSAMITREQFATMMYRYAKLAGISIEKPDESALNQFKDKNKISSYAREAMAWAVSSKLIQGISATEISPNGSATRAQVATILMRYDKWITLAPPVVEPSPTQPEPTGKNEELEQPENPSEPSEEPMG